MQAEYVDKYEEELKKAKEKAGFIPSFNRWKVPYMKFLGTIQGERGNRHYYYDETEDTYYYESDFDKEMRLKLKQSKFKKYAKK